jgi:hypothetical protein
MTRITAKHRPLKLLIAASSYRHLSAFRPRIGSSPWFAQTLLRSLPWLLLEPEEEKCTLMMRKIEGVLLFEVGHHQT